MEKADRLTGRTIQAVIGQSLRGLRPQYEDVQDGAYGDTVWDTSKWSHAVWGYVDQWGQRDAPSTTSGGSPIANNQHKTLIKDVCKDYTTQRYNITEIQLCRVSWIETLFIRNYKQTTVVTQHVCLIVTWLKCMTY